MFKRLISCLIIFSMLWGDIAAAMDDETETKQLPSVTGIKPSPTLGTPLQVDLREKSPLLNGKNGTTYHTTPMTDIVPSDHSVNGFKKSGSSSDEEDRRVGSSSSDEHVGDRKADKKKCPSCWPCRKKQENRLVIRERSSDSEDERSVDSGLFGEEEKTCCFRWSWPSCCKKKGGEEDVESSSSPKTCCWSPFSCCQKKGGEEDVEASPKTGCWPFSCCKKGSLDEHSGESGHLLIVERDPSLRELKEQALRNLVIPVEEDQLSDVIHLEDQILDEREVVLKKAQFLYSKIKGTSLEDFGRWFQGHVVENRWRWQDWGGLGWAVAMAAGTSAAMSDIVEYSIYNSFFAHHLKQYLPIVGPLADYINVSAGLTALVDSGSFMQEATSPSTRTFTMHKSAKEKRYDRILIPLVIIAGVYLEWLFWYINQLQQQNHNQTKQQDEDSTGWWNANTQYFVFSSIGFFPYLVAQSWKGMKNAVSRVFHPTVLEHVKGRVLALRELDASLDSFSKEELANLYDLLKYPLLAQNSKVKAWARYFFKGDIADEAKVEGLLAYVTLTQYAQEHLHFNEEVNPEEGSHTTRKAARILAGLGLPAGFSLIAVSLFGLFSAFMDWKGALALSITMAALGFVPEAFLQSHNVQETLDDISVKGSGPKRGWKESVKDPYWWGAGAAKVVGMVWAFCQNALTNLAPIIVSLVMLIPAYLGGSDETQKAITGVLIGLAIPYLISELLSGTHDMWGHAASMAGTARDFCYGVYDHIVKWCTQKDPLSPSQKKREIRRILKGAIRETLIFTPRFVKDLDKFEQKVKGIETF